jgi:hypothetical protein
MSLPCGVVVSAQVSASDLNPAPRLAISSSVLSKSRVLRASRSSRVTINTSLSPSRASALRSFSPIGLGPTRLLSEHFGATGAPQRRVLRDQRLPVCAHPRIAVCGHDRTSLLCITFAQHKPFSISVRLDVRCMGSNGL